MSTRMRLRCLVVALVVVAGHASPVFAQQPIPSLQRHVTDLTATLSTAQQNALEQRLQQFEDAKGSQIAVLIVATTQPEDIAQYSIRVVEQWRLGRNRIDDGILMLLAKNDRKTRIEVGYGLEGVVPDALSKRIIDDIMIPYFRSGDFAGGISAGVDSLTGLIQGEPLPAANSRAIGVHLDQNVPILFLLALAVGALIRAILGRLLGGLVNGSATGVLIWYFGGGVILALVLALFAFILTQIDGRSLQNAMDFDGGSSGGGGYSGGGGGFGGGGASGGW